MNNPNNDRNKIKEWALEWLKEVQCGVTFAEIRAAIRAYRDIEVDPFVLTDALNDLIVKKKARLHLEQSRYFCHHFIYYDHKKSD